MKILFAIPSLAKGGAERILIDVCRELHRRNAVSYQLVIFNSLNEYQDLTQDLNIVYCNVVVKTFRINSGKNKLNEWHKIVDDFQPDIIHSHVYLADLISRSRINAKIKYFSQLHGRTTQFERPPIAWLFSKPRQFFERVFERAFVQNLYLKSNTLFFCVSEYYKEYLERNLGYKQNCVFHNAIDYSRFFAEKAEKQNPILQLITVGRLIENKNHDFLIKVGEVLKEKGVDFKLKVLGEGHLWSSLQDAIEKSNLSNEVSFLGNVNNPEYYYKESDIYIHSAYDESFGLTLLEAMAAGLPVITLDGKGNRDLIVQGKNGFMLFEQDSEKFADKILEVWENKNLYQEMSVFAQEFARKYDIKDYVDKLLKLYRGSL